MARIISDQEFIDEDDDDGLEIPKLSDEDKPQLADHTEPHVRHD